MTLAELRSELSDRGFDYLSSARLNRYLQQSIHEICSHAPWPFLETSTTKTHGQTLTDLSSILSVYNSTDEIELAGTTRDYIKQNINPDLTTTGTAEYWYLTGEYTFNVFPVDSTTSFTIYYLEVPDELNDGDEPLIPDRFQDLIIDRAAIKGYKDTDQWDAVSALKVIYQEDLEAMVAHFFARNLQNPDQITHVAEHEWAYGW